jgi:Glycosyl hydrolases family 16
MGSEQAVASALRRVPPTRRSLVSAVCGMVLAGSALVAVAVSTPAQVPHRAPSWRPVPVSSCIGYCKRPTNAAKVFRWGLASWDQEFLGTKLGKNWRSDHPALIGQHLGMLTLDGTQDQGTITAWPSNQAARVGRWEARVRAREFAKPGAHYRYIWELVPADGNDSCGANSVVLGSFVPGDARVRGAVNTLPDHSFTYSRKRDLRSGGWHTYAIEITKKHISWFVDTQVIRTERRPAALSGVTYRPQFVMQAVPGATMKPSLMTMDWVRYYTLDRPNAKSIAAPRMTKNTVSRSC